MSPQSNPIPAPDPVVLPPGRLALRTRDLDEMAEAVSYLGTEIHQLGRGPFSASLDLLALGRVAVLEFSLGQTIHAHGCRPGVFGFDLMSHPDGAVAIQHRPARFGQINVVCPPGEWDHVSTVPESQHLHVTVDAEALRHEAKVLHGIDIDERLGGDRLVDATPEAFAALEARLRGLLNQARTRPEVLSGLAEQRLGERLCLELILKAVLGDASAVGESRRAVNQRQVVSQAVDFMAANLTRTLCVADICEEIGVSERTLRYAFEELFALGPMAYFKARKLEAVRQELKAAEPAPGVVHEVARRWGFRHTGHFAADYHRQFGELPSRTLEG